MSNESKKCQYSKIAVCQNISSLDYGHCFRCLIITLLKRVDELLASGLERKVKAKESITFYSSLVEISDAYQALNKLLSEAYPVPQSEEQKEPFEETFRKLGGKYIT